MRKIICLVVLLLILLGVFPVYAIDFDFDDLFQDDVLVEMDEGTGAAKPEEALLVHDGLELGGNYSLTLNAARRYIEDLDLDPEDSLSISLRSDLYADVRPKPDFRVFAKANLAVDVDRDDAFSMRLKLRELFTDFNYENQVFFRAGKQQVKWGVGHFFSPADVVSSGRIDPQNPDRSLEGPIALKIQYPRKSNNYYTYLLFDQVTALNEIAIAPKLEFVVGRSELGLGAYYQQGKAPRVMATVSSSLGDVGLFAEAMVSKGSDKGFVSEQGLLDYPLRENNRLFFHATAGGHYTYSHPEGLLNLTGAVQYYFNGEGYRDQSLIADFRQDYAIARVLFPDRVAHVVASDLTSTGRHYLGAMVNWSQILDSKLSLASVWTANLSDRSGIFSTTLSLPSFRNISPSVGVSFNYGEALTEFGLTGQRITTVFAAVKLGSGSF